MKNQKKYFSQSSLQTLKQDIDLVFAIGEKVNLIKKGKRFFGKCPIHKGSSNSLVVSPKKNLWYCFGGCKNGGSIVDWVMATEGLRLVEALSFLAEQYPFLAQKGQLGNYGLNETVPEQYDLPQHQPILLQIVKHYQASLASQSRAIQYLHGLGLSKSKIEKFQIGFCDGTLKESYIDQINPDDKLLTSAIVNMGLLQKIGNDDLQEPFNGQIIFPVFDEFDQCINLFSRAVPDKFNFSHMQVLAS